MNNYTIYDSEYMTILEVTKADSLAEAQIYAERKYCMPVTVKLSIHQPKTHKEAAE